MAIDPTFAIQGGEWSMGLGAAGSPAGAKPSAAGNFGGALADQIGALENLQTEAASGSRALAAGTASDPTDVVMAVERARLGMQLASQIRTKAVDAIQDIFHTQV